MTASESVRGALRPGDGGPFAEAHLVHAFGAPPPFPAKDVPLALQALQRVGALRTMSEVSLLLQFGKHRFLLRDRPDLARDLTGTGFWMLCTVLWMLALHELTETVGVC